MFPIQVGGGRDKGVPTQNAFARSLPGVVPQEEASLSDEDVTGNSSPASPTDEAGNASGILGVPISGEVSYPMKSYPHCPVFVLSKGRGDLDRGGTLANLVQDLVPFSVVVEKEEAAIYGELLDALVFRFFGASHMKYHAEISGTEEESKDSVPIKGEDAEKGKEETHSSPLSSSNCTSENNSTNSYDNNSRTPSSPCVSPRPPPGNRRCACCCANSIPEERSFASIVSKAYHHGYVFAPLQAEESTPEWRTKAFTLHTVDEVRQLFKVEVLPDSNRGVSFVRNYILHVLAPRLMVETYMDESGHIEELDIVAANQVDGVAESVLRRWELDPATYQAMEERKRIIAEKRRSARLHALMGFYWVLDDDIYSFVLSNAEFGKNKRVSPRNMMCEVERRVLMMEKNSSQKAAALNPYGSVFTCKEEALVNNYIAAGQPLTTAVTIDNFEHLAKTAIISLEYSRFTYYQTYDENCIAVNSYNNIACLFRYDLLHIPTTKTIQYFPSGSSGVRTVKETLVGYAGNMMWYRFAVREDYDFTLQLIARGFHTIRFRKIGFDVPQMAKLRGGMTDYYKNCQPQILVQNQRFIEQWPSISQRCLKGKNSTRREDIRIRWDLLHPAKARYPGAYLYLKELLPQIAPINQEKLAEELAALAKAAAEEKQEQQQEKTRKPLLTGGEREVGPSSVSGDTVEGTEVTDKSIHNNHNSNNNNNKEEDEEEGTEETKTMGGVEKVKRNANAAPVVVVVGNTQTSPSSAATTTSPVTPSTSRLLVEVEDSEGKPEDPSVTTPISTGKNATTPDSTRQQRKRPRDETKRDGVVMARGYSPRSPPSTSHVRPSGATNKPRKRRRSPSSESSVSSSLSSSSLSSATDSDSDSDSASSRASSESTTSTDTPPPMRTRRRTPPPTPTVGTASVVTPPASHNRQRHDTTWKGFTVVPWRDILPEEAMTLGLIPIPPDALHVGKQVLIIPPSFSHTPSALVATLVDKTPTVAKHSTLCVRYPNQEEEVIEWSAVANRMRGIPLLTVVHCYEIPTTEPLEAVAARVDEFFRNLLPILGKNGEQETEGSDTEEGKKNGVESFLD